MDCWFIFLKLKLSNSLIKHSETWMSYRLWTYCTGVNSYRWWTGSLWWWTVKIGFPLPVDSQLLQFSTIRCLFLLFLVQVRLKIEVLSTLSSTRQGFELMTCRSWQHTSCHWDACSNHSAIGHTLKPVMCLDSITLNWWAEQEFLSFSFLLFNSWQLVSERTFIVICDHTLFLVVVLTIMGRLWYR